MAGIDVGGGRGARRSLDSEINMVPMIDLLMVTISFLLLTAVWVHTKRLDGATNVPGPDHTKPKVEDHARVHVAVPANDAPLELTLRDGTQLIESTKLARSEMPRLAERVAAMRRAHGADPVVVLHVDDSLSYGQMVAVMDAISADRQASVSLATK